MAKGNFFKRNEKLLMVILLLILAPTFAFTGIMSQVLGSRNPKAYEIFGRTIKSGEFQKLSSRMAANLRIAMVRTNGPLALFQRDLNLTADEVINEYIQLREADRLGIVVAGKDAEDAIRDAAKDVLAAYDTYEDMQTGKLPSALTRSNIYRIRYAYLTRRSTEAVDVNRYMKALEVLRLPRVEVFEDLVLEQARIARLHQAVVAPVSVSEKEVYQEFLDDRQKRDFDFVRIPTSRFLDEARKNVKEADMRKLFEDSPDRFDSPPQIQLEVAKIRLDDLRKSLPAPTEEAIKARYEKIKDTTYVKPPEEGLSTQKEGEKKPEKQYIPLSNPEVHDGIAAYLKDEALQDRQKKILEDALKKAVGLSVDKPGFSLTQAFGDDAAYVHDFRTDFFDEESLSKLPESIRNDAALQALFAAGRKPSVGELSRAVVTVTDGDYIYRVAAKKDSEFQSFDKCKDRVAEIVAKRNAVDLAEKYVKSVADKIRTSDETLQSWAKKEKYTIQNTGMLTRYEASKIKVDTRTLKGARDLISEGFGLEKVGDLGAPVIPQGVDREDIEDVLLVRFAGEAPPDPADFEKAKTSLENRVQRQKEQALWSEFVQKLLKAADVKRYGSSNDES